MDSSWEDICRIKRRSSQVSHVILFSVFCLIFFFGIKWLSQDYLLSEPSSHEWKVFLKQEPWRKRRSPSGTTSTQPSLRGSPSERLTHKFCRLQSNLFSIQRIVFEREFVRMIIINNIKSILFITNNSTATSTTVSDPQQQWRHSILTQNTRVSARSLSRDSINSRVCILTETRRRSSMKLQTNWFPRESFR